MKGGTVSRGPLGRSRVGNLTTNASLDGQGFAAFGKVVARPLAAGSDGVPSGFQRGGCVEVANGIFVAINTVS